MRIAGMARRGLYAITPGGTNAGELLARAEKALIGGAVWLQYRAKPAPDAKVAARLRDLCRAHGAVFIVNDHVRLAAEVYADGVHLGREDLDVAAARAIVGPERVIGVSCYDDLDRAERLAGAGADYLAFGSVFASPTKPGAVRCPLEVLARARRFGLPVVAIGGITADNAAVAIAAGADLVAVISDLFEAPDVRARAAEYAALFQDS